MPEPVTMGLLGGFALVSFAQGFGTRIASKYFPTKLEKHQVLNLRFQQELADRQFKEREEARKADQEKFRREIAARFELAEWNKQLEFWPLLVLPGSILEMSRVRNSLNIIAVYKRARGVTDTGMMAVSGALDDMENLALTQQLHSSPVQFYKNPIAPHTMHHVRPIASGQTLVSQMWQPLRSEPCVLIEVSSLSDHSHRILGAIWGFEGPNGGAEVIAPIEVDLAGVPPPYHGRALSFALQGFTSVLIDVMGLMRTPTFSVTPNAPLLLPPDVLDGPEGGAATAAYMALLDGVASHAPALGISNLLSAAEHLGKADRFGPAGIFFDSAMRRAAAASGRDRLPREWYEYRSLGTVSLDADGQLRRRFSEVARILAAGSAGLRAEPETRAEAVSLIDLASAMNRRLNS